MKTRALAFRPQRFHDYAPSCSKQAVYDGSWAVRCHFAYEPPCDNVGHRTHNILDHDVTSRHRRGDRTLLELPLVPLQVRWCLWSVVAIISTLRLEEPTRRSTGLVGISSPEPLTVTLLLILLCPSRRRVKLWRGRARLMWGRRYCTRGVTLCLCTKSPLEWLEGLSHHLLKPAQKGFPLLSLIHI